MVGELTPTRIDPLTADAETWRRFHELRHMQEKERRPDDPVQPDHEIEARMKKGNPFDYQHWYQIARDGVALSSFYAESVTPAAILLVARKGDRCPQSTRQPGRIPTSTAGRACKAAGRWSASLSCRI